MQTNGLGSRWRSMASLDTPGRRSTAVNLEKPATTNYDITRPFLRFRVDWSMWSNKVVMNKAPANTVRHNSAREQCTQLHPFRRRIFVPDLACQELISTHSMVYDNYERCFFNFYLCSSWAAAGDRVLGAPEVVEAGKPSTANGPRATGTSTAG